MAMAKPVSGKYATLTFQNAHDGGVEFHLHGG